MDKSEIKKDYGLTVYRNEKGIEDLLKRFKRRVEKSKILDEVKDRKYFVKPSIKKRLKSKRAKFNNNNA